MNPPPASAAHRKTLRNRKSLTSDLGMGVDRRRSRRHSTGTVPPHLRLTGPGVGGGAVSRREDGEDSSSSQSSQALDTMHLNGNYKESGGTSSDQGTTSSASICYYFQLSTNSVPKNCFKTS